MCLFWLVLRPALQLHWHAPTGTAMCCFLGKYYLRFFQRARYEGLEVIPSAIDPRGLIVISNHVSGVDPVLLQIPLRAHIRWMMSAEMLVPSLRWFWRQERIIPVCYDNRDASAVRAALDHLKCGGVLGIFPEGAIERPAKQIRPFVGGLRVIASRAKCPILMACIDLSGVDPAKPTPPAFASLFRVTRPVVRYLAYIDPAQAPYGKDLGEKLRERMQAALGYPDNPEPLEAADPELVNRNLSMFQNYSSRQLEVL